MMRTAVQSTTSLLASALKESRRESKSMLKTVVFMSSISAVFDPTAPPNRRFTEDSWNIYAEAATPEVQERLRQGHGSEDPSLGYLFYQATKVAAERAFWQFGRENVFPVDMVALCPA
jgi:nucleoside-diphosphate-sugar epimerase